MIESMITPFRPHLFSPSTNEVCPSGLLFGLSNETIRARFSAVESEVSSRWITHCSGVDFPKYSSGQSTQEIEAEFSKFIALRNQIICTPSIPMRLNAGFEPAEQLVANHRYRQPNTITFEHSKTDNTYNSTCLTVNGRRYFALEGPTEETLEYFYRLLLRWDVGMLICLTGESENGIPKCYPYWENTAFFSGTESFIGIPIEDQYHIPLSEWKQKKMPYLHLSEWKDNSSYREQKLVDAVNYARSQISKDQIMAIHCSAGVGRTGTFLALMALMDDIDSQVAKGVHPNDVELSVAGLYLKLNLHRRPLIANKSQYLTVYRAVDCYLEKLCQDLDA